MSPNRPRHLGFICHPLDFAHLASIDPQLARKSPRLVRQVMAQVPPRHVRTYSVTSPTGEMITVDLFCVWLLPDQFVHLPRPLVVRRILEAMELAADRGCEMVGLGAYTKILAHSAPECLTSLPFPVTTGNTLTSALAVRTLERLAAQRGLDRTNAELAIVGATGAIGNAVARALAPQVKRINLVGRNTEALNRIAAEVQACGAVAVVETDAKVASREADLVFLATSEPGLLIQAADLSYGCCVVDVSKPVNILPDLTRPDVQVVDCAMVATPPKAVLQNPVRCFPDVEGLDSEEVFACFAETMVLGLEGELLSYSKDRHLDLSRFSQILVWAKKHGFGTAVEVGPWRFNSKSRSNDLTRAFGIAS